MKKIYLLMIALFVVNGAMAQWVPLNSGTTKDLNSVYFTEASVGYVVGRSGTILKTTDGGDNWIPQNAGSTTASYNSVHFPSQDTGYAVGYPGVILKTTNGGEGWTNQNSGTDQSLHSVYFLDANTGYATGNISMGGSPGTQGYTACVILKTTNGGSDWTVNYSDTSYRFESVYFTDANTGYVVGLDDIKNEGYIVKTTDGGANWTAQNLGDAVLYSVFFTTADTGYIAGGDLYSAKKIYKTTNRGVLWTNMDSLMSIGLLSSVHFPVKDTGYIVGYDGTILKTTNGGTVWTNQSCGTTKWLRSVYFTDPNNGYIVGDNGIILKTTNGGGFPAGINDHQQTPSTLNIYPNPASNIITIEAPTKGLISIHNTTGQQLLQQEITEPTTTIDVSGLNSRVYFVRLTGNSTVKVGKFIKQ